MKIGQLAKRTGFSVGTLRYYEHQGLLEKPGRAENGYRAYSEDCLPQLMFIDQAKSVGFSLTEIKQLLSISELKNEHTCGEVKAFVGKKITEIETQIAQLQQMLSTLDAMHSQCVGGDETAAHCPILQEFER